MIYVTGDLHGDITRFKSKAVRRLKKNDYLLICGDFGFIWDGSKRERRLLKWIGKRRFYTLFVEGTHDNLELINSYPTAQWNGGVVNEISGKLKHLRRGGVFMLDNRKIFAFGGGESSDAADRISDGRWWRQELPTPVEIEEARENLKEHKNKVDYIITHQSSRRIKRFLTMIDNDANVLDAFFDEVRENCTYERWFFGGYHINKVIPPSEMALFSAVEPTMPSRI